MRIAVIGAGGLGGYFGARLCQGGADVHFVARGRHLEAMRSQGLRVEGPTGIHIPRVNATDDPSEIGHLCVVLGEIDAMRTADLNDLAHDVEQKGSGLSVLADWANGSAHRQHGTPQTVTLVAIGGFSS